MGELSLLAEQWKGVVSSAHLQLQLLDHLHLDATLCCALVIECVLAVQMPAEGHTTRRRQDRSPRNCLPEFTFGKSARSAPGARSRPRIQTDGDGLDTGAAVSPLT